jgi:hypothetical protein
MNADPACRYCATTASTCQQYPSGCCPDCSDRTHTDYAAILAAVPREYLLRELAERDDTHPAAPETRNRVRCWLAAALHWLDIREVGRTLKNGRTRWPR